MKINYLAQHGTTNNEKSAQRRKHCVRAGCSKVRTLPARLLGVTNPQTGPITIHCTAAT